MDVVVQGLRFERDGRCVLDVPRLELASGRTTAVFGPNGSGKTTLLRIIACLEWPTRGSVGLGAIASPCSRAARYAVAFAFQEAVFVRGSVRANLELGLHLRRIAPNERSERVAEAARECGIEHLLDRSAARLSGGEAQRVNLARALALRAPVTLLDEPLTGLDRQTRAQLLDDLPRLLATFATTTILVTHDREEAFRIADSLVVLIDGAVRAAGPKGDVYRHPSDRATAELLGYTVLPIGGALRAIAPGGLEMGSGPHAFEIVVERVVDMGTHIHLQGSAVGGSESRVDLRLPPGVKPPEGGDRVTVSMRESIALR